MPSLRHGNVALKGASIGTSRRGTGGHAPMKLMAGNSNLPLASAIADYLEIPLTQANVRRFADEEIFVEMSNSNVVVDP